MMLSIFWISAIFPGISALKESTSRGCTIPSQWHGSWLEAHIGEVVISSTEITKKGRCLQNGGNYFLFDNREIGCLTCMLILQKHINVIQYRESVCMGRSSFDSICSTIQLDAIQRTLIKAPHETLEKCPFTTSYYFSYNNNSGGICREPLSALTTCSSPSMLHFSFEQCQGVAYSVSRNVKMECLAVWQGAGHNFMVGRFLHSYHQHDQYRCFMYQIFGTLAQASMSADASCRGLRSHRDGPTVFEFSAVPTEPSHWPDTQCVFPRWLTSSKWRDFSNQQLLQVDVSGQLLSIHSHGTPGEVSLLFRCLRETTSKETTTSAFRALVSVMNVCKLQYQCMQFIRRNLDVIELHLGLAAQDEFTNDCSDTTILFNNKFLLIRTPLPSNRMDCIEEGQYRIYTGVLSCHSYLRSGCSKNYIIDIISSCSSKPGLQLRCLSIWNFENRRYIIAAQMGDRRSESLSCYVFYQKDDVSLFSYDPHCQDGVSSSNSEKFTYVMEIFSVPCKPTEGPSSIVVLEPQRNLSLVPYSVFQVRGNDFKALKQVINSSCDVITFDQSIVQFIIFNHLLLCLSPMDA